jgi:putative peptidoglycan lipid II flippase
MTKKWLPGLIGLSIFAIAGRLLGFAREALMASKFGANDITDAYLTTLLLFDIAIAANSSILSGTLSYTAGIKNVPQIRRALLMTGLKAGGILLLAAILFYPLAEPLARALFGYSEVALNIIIDSSRLFLFLTAFLVSSGVFSARLQMEGKITVPGRLVIFLNVSSILMLILFTKEFGIIALPIGLFLGGVLFFLYQTFLILYQEPQIGSSGKSRFHFAEWAAIVSLIFCNSLLPSLSGFVERCFAVYFNPGTFSHYQYAVKIILLPLTIFSFAISTSLLPVQSKSVSQGNEQEFTEVTSRSVFLSVVSSVYFVLIFAVAAEAIIQLVYQRGHFGQHDSLETATALRIMSAGLVPFLLNPVLANVFYLRKSSRLIISINLLFILSQAGLLLIFSRIIPGVTTFAVSWVIIVWLNNCVLVLVIHKRLNLRFERKFYARLFMVFAFAAGLSLVAKWFFEVIHFFPGIEETGLILLYKTGMISLVLFILYAGLVSIIFRTKLKTMWAGLKKQIRSS